MWKWELLSRLIRWIARNPQCHARYLQKLIARLGRDLDELSEGWEVSQRFLARPDHPCAAQLPVVNSVAVVMQGPVVEPQDFTIRTLEHYRITFGESPLILSTWRPLDPALRRRAEAIGVIVLENEVPQLRGPANLNCQLRSTWAGLQEAKRQGAAFAIKTRCDTRYYAPNLADFLVGLWRAFPAGPSAPTQGRIVALDFATRKYIPYHLSDLMSFGRTEDLLSYWGRPEVDADLQAEKPPRFGHFVQDPMPEVMICRSFLQRHAIADPPTLEAWWRVLAEQFLIVDRDMLEFFWWKYNYGQQQRIKPDDFRRNMALVSFRDWMNLAAFQKQPPVSLDDLADERVHEIVRAA